MVRAALRSLVEVRPHMKVVGEAHDYARASGIARTAQPDIALVELDSPDESELQGLAQIRDACRNVRILVLSGGDSKLHQFAVKMGATGIVQRGESPEVLIKAIEKVHAGEAWIDRSTMADIVVAMGQGENEPRQEAPPEIGLLTNREREITTLVCLGMKNKQIAHHLSISDITVRHHLTSVFSKLRVTDRFELIIYAYRHGLAEPPE